MYDLRRAMPETFKFIPFMLTKVELKKEREERKKKKSVLFYEDKNWTSYQENQVHISGGLVMEDQ